MTDPFKKRRKIRKLILSKYYINRAAAYWREGLNTFEISEKMDINEAHLWNNMKAIKGHR